MKIAAIETAICLFLIFGVPLAVSVAGNLYLMERMETTHAR